MHPVGRFLSVPNSRRDSPYSSSGAIQASIEHDVVSDVDFISDAYNFTDPWYSFYIPQLGCSGEGSTDLCYVARN